MDPEIVPLHGADIVEEAAQSNDYLLTVANGSLNFSMEIELKKTSPATLQAEQPSSSSTAKINNESFETSLHEWLSQFSNPESEQKQKLNLSLDISARPQASLTFASVESFSCAKGQGQKGVMRLLDKGQNQIINKWIDDE